MAIFAVIVQPNPNTVKLADAIAREYKDSNFVLDGGHGWLVAGSGSAQDVSGKLGITTGENGAAIVVEAASYFGRANTNTWSWIKSNWGVKPNA